MRLIDADALLENLDKLVRFTDIDSEEDVRSIITNAPTVQREEQDNLAGWVRVPIEPTEEMIQAACINQAVNSFNSYEDWAESHSSGIVEKIRSLEINTYKAMIQAAPTDKE